MAQDTMADVIDRSYSMHPTLFAESLEAVAKTHRSAMFSLRFDSKAASIAQNMALNCENMADDIRAGRFEPYFLGFGETIQAFGVASKLQCIPYHVASAIAAQADKASA